MDFEKDTKNWKTYGTIDNVFWDSGTIDKPSEHYINNMNWTEIQLNANMNNIYTITTQCRTKDYGLIKFVNEKTNEVLFYMQKRIISYTRNSYNLEYELDTWTTFNLKLLNKDINVLCDRHQDYDDDKCLEFNDEILDSLDLNFNNIKKIDLNVKKNIVNNQIVYENNNKKISYSNNSEIINGHFCLVLNDNDINDYSAYTFIPILGYSEKQKITSNEQNVKKIVVDKATARYYSKIGKITYEWVEFALLPELVEWYYEQIRNNNKFSVYGFDVASNKIDFTKYFQNVKIENLYMFISNGYMRIIDSRGHLCGNEANGLSFLPDDLIHSKEMNILFSGKDTFLYFESDSSSIVGTEMFDNTMRNINNIIKSQSYSNKVNGIYLIPNVFNLTNCWGKTSINGTNVLTLNIEQQGAKLDNPIVIMNDVKLSNNLIFNSVIPLHKKIYKYYQCNWLNNEIDISYFINNNKVEIDGIINFTNSFNIIHNNSKFLLDNRVLTLPGQQPLKSDNYNKMVNANMNSVNTGYAIQKQQAKIQSSRSIFNSLTMGLFSSLLTKNPLGMIGSLASGIGGVNQAKISIQNYEKQQRSKFADANNTTGNDLLFSSTHDNLWTHLLTANDHFESVMIKELSEDSIKQINNALLLYGIYNPKYFKLNNLPKTTAHLGFYYAKLNTVNFNQIFSKHINESREIKDIILANFNEFRVWDIIPSID